MASRGCPPALHSARRLLFVVAGVLLVGAFPHGAAAQVTEPAQPQAAWDHTPSAQPPHEARVSWTDGQLRVEASDASFNHTLREIARQTGARLDWTGLSGPLADQRLFGTYGPGPAQDVISALLAGSGYNLLMTFSEDTGALRRILLSIRPQGSVSRQPQTVARAEADPLPEQLAEAPPPPPNLSPFANGGTQTNSVEFMQEILDRQAKIDQQMTQQNHAQP